MIAGLAFVIARGLASWQFIIYTKAKYMEILKSQKSLLKESSKLLKIN